MSSRYFFFLNIFFSNIRYCLLIFLILNISSHIYTLLTFSQYIYVIHLVKTFFYVYSVMVLDIAFITELWEHCCISFLVRFAFLLPLELKSTNIWLFKKFFFIIYISFINSSSQVTNRIVKFLSIWLGDLYIKLFCSTYMLAIY